MAYGVNSARPARITAVGKFDGARSSDPVQSSWQLLSETCRLAAVERALSNETDFRDLSPIAL